MDHERRLGCARNDNVKADAAASRVRTRRRKLEAKRQRWDPRIDGDERRPVQPPDVVEEPGNVGPSGDWSVYELRNWRGKRDRHPNHGQEGPPRGLSERPFPLPRPAPPLQWPGTIADASRRREAYTLCHRAEEERGHSIDREPGWEYRTCPGRRRACSRSRTRAQLGFPWPSGGSP